MESKDGKHIILGIGAMNKKSKSKAMAEILGRIENRFPHITISIFEEDVILNQPVDRWPICDCFVSFYSHGFPLEKAIEYVQLRKPFVINKLHRQYDLLSRTQIYHVLKSSAIEVPRHAVQLNETQEEQVNAKDDNFVESDDHIEIMGEKFHKPFVEKPTHAEDHNIVIYFPSVAGGGSQWLFRKVGDKSSSYSKESTVRRTGSYIYEEYLPTDGIDVKVYTVGPFYAHAEARKSPGLDGKVERDRKGKEIRYPVILSNLEKTIARKVVLAFEQNVCGFDLLRCNGKSYVCDVNGFSFVKNSPKYYDDAANILGELIMRRFAPTLRIPWRPQFQMDEPPLAQTTSGRIMELRCVLAVIRHGDRTPKQKMKVELNHPKFFTLFRKYKGFEKGQLKLKRPNQLQEVLDLVREVLGELGCLNTPPVSATPPSISSMKNRLQMEDLRSKFGQIKDVLEMYGHFTGINRKVQLKYMPHGSGSHSCHSSASDQSVNGSSDERKPALLLIIKWGGELTPAGKLQALEMGKAFQGIYPGGEDSDISDSDEKLGFLRLHSTYRHDLKIYASEEGRVQMTGGAFAKGLLSLEGEIPPILVSMVKSANTSGLLDDDQCVRKIQNTVKRFLHDYLQKDVDFGPDDYKALNPLGDTSIQRCLEFIQNPRKMCERIHALLCRLVGTIKAKRAKMKEEGSGDRNLYVNESLALVEQRWTKLMKEFRPHKKLLVIFDISKIPDIYDNAKYCYQHNEKSLEFDDIDELYILSKNMADIVVHQEYGISLNEKLLIGQGTCVHLLEKIRADLQQSSNNDEEADEALTRLDRRYMDNNDVSPLRHVRTRLYFTSESHIHSLMNLIRYGNLIDPKTDEEWHRAQSFLNNITEYNYMSQLVFMLYEDTSRDPKSPDRFHTEIHFSPGALPCIATASVPGLGYRSSVKDATNRNLSLISNSEFGDDNNNLIGTKDEVDDINNNDTQNKEIGSPKKTVHFYHGPEEEQELDDSFNDSDQTISEADETEQLKMQYTVGMRHTKAECCCSITSCTSRTRNTSVTESPNKLISTAVISGRFPGSLTPNNSFVDCTFDAPDSGFTLKQTSIIGRRQSVPHMAKLVLTKNEKPDDFKEEPITEFVPPIRSLETLHNRLVFDQLDVWITNHAQAGKQLTNSPPPSPISRETST